jgi:hypothetical protein
LIAAATTDEAIPPSLAEEPVGANATGERIIPVASGSVLHAGYLVVLSRFSIAARALEIDRDRSAALLVADRILATTPAHDIRAWGDVRRPAVAIAVRQSVPAIATDQPVTPSAAVEPIFALSTDDLVIARVAVENVPAIEAGEAVVARSPAEVSPLSFELGRAGLQIVVADSAVGDRLERTKARHPQSVVHVAELEPRVLERTIRARFPTRGRVLVDGRARRSSGDHRALVMDDPQARAVPGPLPIDDDVIVLSWGCDEAHLVPGIRTAVPDDRHRCAPSADGHDKRARQPEHEHQQETDVASRSADPPLPTHPFDHDQHEARDRSSASLSSLPSAVNFGAWCSAALTLPSAMRS